MVRFGKSTANLILLLISSSFINSKYCYCTELKRAISGHELMQNIREVIELCLEEIEEESTTEFIGIQRVVV